MGRKLIVDGDLIAHPLLLFLKRRCLSVRRCSIASVMHTWWPLDEDEQVRVDPRTDQSGVIRDEKNGVNGGDNDDDVCLCDE